MTNQLAIVSMRKTMWLYEIFLAIIVPKVLCEHYRSHIGLATLPTTRQYKNTDHNHTGGWIVRIVDMEGHFACGGAYISPIIVVTSGNCMEPYRHSVSGLLAETDEMLGNEDNFSFIDTFYTPPEFEDNKNYMDVAVLRLRHPIRGKRTEFIKLCETHIKPNMNLNSYGWGYGSFTILTISPIAIMKPAPIIDMDTCKRRWLEGKKKRSLSSSIFCVQYDTSDRTQCLYDPGCPLIYKDQLCGIVSVGTTCLHSHIPTIYTDIMKVRDFILLIESQIRMGFRITTV